MKRLKIILQSNYLYTILLIFIVLFIIVTTKLIKYESIYQNANEIKGVIIDINYNLDKVSFTLKSQEKIICNYYLKENEKFNYKNLLGKKVIVKGTIKAVYNNTIPNTFNYKKYLYNNKIYKLFTVSNIEIIKNENIFYKIKNKINNKIDSYQDSIKSYLSLFILGDKTSLDNNVYDNYRLNGIWHLFAISGMHISLIIIVLNNLLKKIKFKNIIISICLLYFMFLTDFSASVMRAIIFYYLKIILDNYKIKLDNKKILFLTAFIILIINPFMIYNVGFQYSFLITYAIMHESKKITGNYFVKILKISLLSFLVSLPITVNMNYEINILSILLNVIFVPFITFCVFPLSIITFIIPFFSVALEYTIFILEFSNKLMNNLSINIIISKMSLIIIILYYLLLSLFSKANSKKYLILLFAVMLFNHGISKLNNSYNINYFDVGQGDCGLIITPFKNEVIMIDTGGLINSDYHVSNNIILYLKSIGITKINKLIITHGDYDHMGEAINLVENFKVDKVIFNCGEFNDLEQELINILDKKKIPYYSCIKELKIDDNKLYFLQTKEYDNENDNSNVIYTELDGYKFMFMGDASTTTEKEILDKYDLLDIDVLKVGHHGSKTSSSEGFINEINPRYSIISVGKNNRYGHPNYNVLDNLEDSKIYRTDQDGSIMFKIENNKLEIEMCTP